MASGLAEAIDRVNEAHFWGQQLAKTESAKLAKFIAGRQGLPGAYFGSFALFEDEIKKGVRLFTGERAVSASARHIMGEEGCRALRLLRVKDKTVQGALSAATAHLLERIGPIQPAPAEWRDKWWANYMGGVFCCASCSVGFWRHLVAGGFDHQEQRLKIGMKYLKLLRRSDGEYRAAPFWWTMSVLVELPAAMARDEIRYAANRLEKYRNRKGPPRDVYAERRHEIARRALEIA